MPLAVGDTVYGQVQTPAGLAWCKGLILELKGSSVFFAISAEPWGEEKPASTVTVGRFCMLIARGMPSQLHSQPPRQHELLAAAPMPEFRALMRAYYALESEEQTFVTPVGTEDESGELEKLRAEVIRLKQQVSLGRPSDPRAAAAATAQDDARAMFDLFGDETQAGEGDPILELMRKSAAQWRGEAVTAEGDVPLLPSSSAAPLPSTGMPLIDTPDVKTSKDVPKALLSSLMKKDTLNDEDMNKAFQLHMMQMMAKMSKPSDGGESDDDDDLTSSLVGPRASATGAVSKYNKLKLRHTNNPKRNIRLYVDEVRRRLGVQQGQPWNFADDTRKLNMGRFSSMVRVHTALGEVLHLQLQNKHLAATSLVVQLLKSIHQMTLDQGSWKLAWLLTFLPDPLSRPRFGGTEEELETLSSFVKSLDELEKRTSNSAATGSGGPSASGGALNPTNPTENPEEADQTGNPTAKAKGGKKR